MSASCSSGVSVLVAGAGLAGLAAARDLAALGADGHRRRRARPRRRARLDDPRRLRRRPARRGRRRLDRRGARTRSAQLAERARPEARRASCAAASATSGRIGPAGRRSCGATRRAAGSGWPRRSRPDIEPYRLAEQRWDSPIAADLARRSVASWLDAGQRRRGAARDRDRPARVLSRRSRGAVADRARRSVRGRRRAGPGAMYRIEGGNDRLATALAAPLGDRLRSEHRGRRRLASRPGRCASSVKNGRRAVADQRATTRSSRCRPSLLRRIPITPALPAQQHDAIARPEVRTRDEDAAAVLDSRFWRGAGPAARVRIARCRSARSGTATKNSAAAPGILTLLAGGGASDATQAIVAKNGPRGLVDALDWLGATRRRARRVASDRLGAGSVRARRLRVLRSGVRSGAARVARAAVRAAVLRRRAHQHQVAGLHERRGRKRPPRGRRSGRRSHRRRSRRPDRRTRRRRAPTRASAMLDSTMAAEAIAGAALVVERLLQQPRFVASVQPSRAGASAAVGRQLVVFDALRGPDDRGVAGVVCRSLHAGDRRLLERSR